MKRKYFKIKKEYLEIALKRNCFLNRIKRRVKKISAYSSTAVATTLSSTISLRRHQKNKFKTHMQFFYFFKIHCRNHFSSILRFFGDFFFINPLIFFFKNFIFFNKITQVVNSFFYESEEEKNITIQHFKEDYVFYSNITNRFVSYEEFIDLKNKTLKIFIKEFKKKKKNFKLNSFFFFIFFLKKIKKI